MPGTYPLEIRKTGDGSPTIQVGDEGIWYHSLHGARTESEYVFIDGGLEALGHIANRPIYILECGFGTGLNAWLANQWSQRRLNSISYWGLEPNPIDRLTMTHWRAASDPDIATSDLEILHGWMDGEWHELDSGCNFRCDRLKLEEANLPVGAFDVCFYDAFAPRTQPELWTVEIFRHVFSCMRVGGVLVTYCAKGQVRRNLMEAGWQVERIPGPPGKREMLRARKVPLQRVNLRVYGLILDATGDNVLVTTEHLFMEEEVIKFPGGGVESREGLVDAWWRECREELGAHPPMRMIRQLEMTAVPIRSAFDPEEQLLAVYYLLQLESDVANPWLHEAATEEAEPSRLSAHWEEISSLDMERFRFPTDRLAAAQLRGHTRPCDGILSD